MKGNYLILVVVIVCFSLLTQIACQQHVKVPAEPNAVLTAPEPAAEPEKVEAKKQAVETGPRITFEKTVQDFGEVGPRSKKTCEFKFTNTGDSLLKITKVEACCGATARLDIMQYEPNESGTIKVQYNASTVAVMVTRQLHVVSNDMTNPRAALTIKAKVVPKTSFEPRGGLRFLLKDEKLSCPEITITSLDGKTFAIKDVKSTGNCITIDYDPNEQATKFTLQPQINMENLQRRPTGIVSISLTHPEGETVRIPFTALSRFQINPPQLIAFNAEPGQPITRKIWVINNYGENFEIESTSSENGIIKVMNQDPVRNGYQFMLEIMPPADEGKTRFTDVFLVNIKGGETLKVSCRGFYSRRK